MSIVQTREDSAFKGSCFRDGNKQLFSTMGTSASRIISKMELTQGCGHYNLVKNCLQ